MRKNLKYFFKTIFKLIFQLTIQFNESLTKTFEYPSEASLLAENGIQMSSEGETKSEINNSVIESESSNTSLSSLKTNLALGGSQGI